jgi:hypothetical protein
MKGPVRGCIKKGGCPVLWWQEGKRIKEGEGYTTDTETTAHII